MVIRLGSFEGGREVLSEERKSFSDLNPATGEVLAEVEEATKEDVDRVVKIAQGGFKRWSKIPVAQRSALIHRLADYLESRSEELAEMETRDTGKPLTLSKSLDIPRSIFNFRFFADYAKTLGTEAFQSDDQAINYALRRPVGVAGLISPWNLPLLLLTWKVAPAIAAGNSCVIKPAELTPLTAYELARAAQEVGLPEGVINVVNGFGPQSAGEFLVAHPNVDLISLTGETSTGKAVMASAASTLKRVSFELGGKNPLIVFADCDFDEMIETTVRSSFVNQGEVCLCGSRVYVEEPIFDRFVDAIKARAEALVVGDPFDPKTQMGALISKEHKERVAGFVERAVVDGAKIVTGGGTPRTLTKGNFFEPTIIVDVKSGCEIVTEEVFGPVITVEPFRSEEEVIAKANDTRYGLAATFWTSNLRRAHRMAAQLEAGVIWINTWFYRDLRTPFGGMKQSGIGREGGVHSFEFYTELSNVCIKL